MIHPTVVGSTGTLQLGGVYFFLSVRLEGAVSQTNNSFLCISTVKSGKRLKERPFSVDCKNSLLAKNGFHPRIFESAVIGGETVTNFIMSKLIAIVQDDGTITFGLAHEYAGLGLQPTVWNMSKHDFMDTVPTTT